MKPGIARAALNENRTHTLPDPPPGPDRLPAAFRARMQSLLAAEAGDFFAHYADPPQAGLRFNTLKAASEDLEAQLPFRLEPLPWSPDGRLILAADSPPGLHPAHAAGLYYIQEPAAQAVAEILDPQPGELILDLAAAPGGKTTDIAARMQNRGLLLANEVHPKRVWDLAKNLERWGARNVLVANETPERLAENLPGAFDRVLVDAPCSGEGMFRKMPEAVRDWSPEFVAGCAARQDLILSAAARLVRPGGWLCYSTCTFAPEENEAVVDEFLTAHPDFRLVTPAWRPGYSEGLRTFPNQATPVRLWPHRAPGEGHFIALLQRAGSTQPEPAPSPQRASPALARLQPLWRKFAAESLHPNLDFSPARLLLVKSYLYALPPGLPDLSRLHVVRPGLWLGSFHKDRFEPSHALAMALTPAEARRTQDLDDEKAALYLRREALPSPGEDGWTLVTFRGRFPLGWGKRVRGLLKNHYPQGLRVV